MGFEIKESINTGPTRTGNPDVLDITVESGGYSKLWNWQTLMGNWIIVNGSKVKEIVTHSYNTYNSVGDWWNAVKTQKTVTNNYNYTAPSLNKVFGKVTISNSTVNPPSPKIFFRYIDNASNTDYVLNCTSEVEMSNNRGHDKVTGTTGTPVVTWCLNSFNNDKPIFVVDNAAHPNDLFIITENEYQQHGVASYNKTQLVNAYLPNQQRLGSGFSLALYYKDIPNSRDIITEKKDISNASSKYNLVIVDDHGTVSRKDKTKPSEKSLVNLSNYFEASFDTSLNKKYAQFFSGQKIAISLPSDHFASRQYGHKLELVANEENILDDNYALYDSETKTYRKAVVLNQNNLDIVVRELKSFDKRTRLGNQKVWVGINSGHGTGFEIAKIPVNELFSQ